MINILTKSTKEGYEKGGLAAAIVVCILLIGIVFGVLSGVIAIAMALWNGCLVSLFPIIPHITFWQMWGIYLLCDILLKPSTSSNNKK